MAKILIKGGRIFSGGKEFVGDIFVESGKIKAIDKKITDSADEVINADGLYVFPGGIDAHTHMELPFMGTFSSDDFETGTLAALYGGTTTIVDFAMQKKGSSLGDALNEWHEKAKKSVSDYSFHLGVTDYNNETRKELSKIIQSGVSSFKVFMAYKNALMIDDKQILTLMSDAKKFGGLVSVHAEHGDMLDFIADNLRKENKLSPKYHPVMHAEEAEAEASSRFIDLANYIGLDVYIVHTSSRHVVTRLKQKTLNGNKVYLETCPQYLLLDDSCYERPGFEGAKYVMSPPIRKKADQEILWKGIAEGDVQVVGTDHCPFNFKGQKDMGKDDFTKIPNGAPGVENRMELMFSEGVLKKRVTMARFVEVTATNPSKIFGLTDKGQIAVGFDADIVLFDPNEKHVLSAGTHHQRCDYNSYEGFNVTGKIKTVIANGQVVIREGKADQIKKGQGRFIKRTPYTRSDL